MIYFARLNNKLKKSPKVITQTIIDKFPKEKNTEFIGVNAFDWNPDTWVLSFSVVK